MLHGNDISSFVFSDFIQCKVQNYSGALCVYKCSQYCNKPVRNYILRMGSTRSNVPTSTVALNFTEISRPTCCVMILHVFLNGFCHAYSPVNNKVIKNSKDLSDNKRDVVLHSKQCWQFPKCESWSHSVQHLNMRVHSLFEYKFHGLPGWASLLLTWIRMKCLS